VARAGRIRALEVAGWGGRRRSVRDRLVASSKVMPPLIEVTDAHVDLRSFGARQARARMTARGTMEPVSTRPSTPASPSVSADEAVEEALASARLEALEPSPEVVEDARLVAAGELDADELIARTLARHKR
jgi:hypothetical protein